ncbi:MAG: hypothetical protein AAB638_00650 [Patescibacteria group bacterium]
MCNNKSKTCGCDCPSCKEEKEQSEIVDTKASLIPESFVPSGYSKKQSVPMLQTKSSGYSKKQSLPARQTIIIDPVILEPMVEIIPHKKKEDDTGLVVSAIALGFMLFVKAVSVTVANKK